MQTILTVQKQYFLVLKYILTVLQAVQAEELSPHGLPLPAPRVRAARLPAPKAEMLRVLAAEAAADMVFLMVAEELTAMQE